MTVKVLPVFPEGSVAGPDAVQVYTPLPPVAVNVIGFVTVGSVPPPGGGFVCVTTIGGLLTVTVTGGLADPWVPPAAVQVMP